MQHLQHSDSTALIPVFAPVRPIMWRLPFQPILVDMQLLVPAASPCSGSSVFAAAGCAAVLVLQQAHAASAFLQQMHDCPLQTDKLPPSVHSLRQAYLLR